MCEAAIDSSAVNSSRKIIRMYEAAEHEEEAGERGHESNKEKEGLLETSENLRKPR